MTYEDFKEYSNDVYGYKLAGKNVDEDVVAALYMPKS
jgi:hypothetical protein